MLAAERRNRILERLQEEKRVVVSELSQEYGVSEETIRRDLEKLEKEGLAVKSYGGATINENTSIDMPFNVRKKKNTTGKQRIAELIAGQVQNGDHIILDASTTAVFIAKALKQKKRLTVITNSLEIMIELSDVPEWNIISTGGSLKEGYLALFGPRAVEGLSAFHVEKAIFSCKGFDTEQGVTEGDEQFSQTKQVMMKSADKSILAVDSTKLGKVAFSKVCGLQELDMVVTDKKPEAQWLAVLERYGITCLYPEE